MLSVSLLGGFHLKRDETDVTEVDTPRMQALLAYLILNKGAPQSRAHVAFLFWPETSEGQARTNLRNLLHNLRRALPEPDVYLDIYANTIQWRSDSPYSSDMSDFEAALSKVNLVRQSKDSTAIRDALEQATGLYKGDLLPDCYEDWIIPKREELRQSYLHCLEELVRLEEEQRDYPAAILNAQRLLNHDMLHEGTYRLLIRLHALNGNRAGALRTYHTCTTILHRELGVEPSPATRGAYEKLLGAGFLVSHAPPASAAFSPLIGRNHEWAKLLHAWRAAATGEPPHIFVICGEAGIGKTRIVEDFLQWANRQGIVTASANCYAAEGELAFAPAAAWLRSYPQLTLEDVWLTELSRVMPEILSQRADLPRPAAFMEAWQRERFFEAMARAILHNNQPLLLTIDDLQWCDRETLEWLHYLQRYNTTARMLVVGTYRSEEVDASHPLTAFLQALRLAGLVTEVELRPLDEDETGVLACRIAGIEISKKTARYIYHQTEGNPLFVVEIVRAGVPAENDASITYPCDKFSADIPSDVADIPQKILTVLDSRLAQLTPPSRELAGLAAAIGREFSFNLLARASGHDEHALVRELDELWQRRIVREQGKDSYDFSHDKLREVAYRSMSAARRRLLHRLIAEALEIMHSANLDPVSRQVASQYEHAGLFAHAVPYYLRAALVARQVFANDEALELLRRGLGLAESRESKLAGSEIIPEITAQLLEEMGDVLELTAQHDEALQAYENAFTYVPLIDRIWQARLNRKTGAVRREQRRYEEELSACKHAEQALGMPPQGDDQLWWDEWLEVQVEQVWAHYWLAQWREMDELVNKVRPVVQLRRQALSRMRFLMASCLLHLRKERYNVSDEMLADSREALTISHQYGSLRFRTECQFEIGFLHLWRRELVEAEENLRAALELAETCGIIPIQTIILTYLTVVYRFRGQTGEVMTLVNRAQESAQTAHMPDYAAAAAGNLAWLAWRRGDMQAAEQSSREALAIWRQSPLAYPFQWMALWPLIAAAHAQGREADVWTHTRALLESTQQHLPARLLTVVSAAIEAHNKGRSDAASVYLEQAMDIALEIGYL